VSRQWETDGSGSEADFTALGDVNPLSFAGETRAAPSHGPQRVLVQHAACRTAVLCRGSLASVPSAARRCVDIGAGAHDSAGVAPEHAPIDGRAPGFYAPAVKSLAFLVQEPAMRDLRFLLRHRAQSSVARHG
jgi:hypothetical protein